MTTQVFSREYLQGLPEERKQLAMKNVIQLFIQLVKQHASMGKTSCIFQPSRIHIEPQSQPTTEEYVTVLQSIFPDCVVEYRESWIETSTTSRVLKKGIIVDWS